MNLLNGLCGRIGSRGLFWFPCTIVKFGLDFLLKLYPILVFSHNKPTHSSQIVAKRDINNAVVLRYEETCNAATRGDGQVCIEGTKAALRMLIQEGFKLRIITVVLRGSGLPSGLLL